MNQHSRREFLADVGRGMLVASVGPAAAQTLGLASARGAEAKDTLTFGAMEPLVALMQETPVRNLLPALVNKLREGTELRTLVAAGALANARAFGGQDYTGYHTFMALVPALHMSTELPESQRALPVLKVLYRNTDTIQGHGGRDHDVLHTVQPAVLPQDKPAGEMLRDATRQKDARRAEATFAAIAQGKLEDAYNSLQFIVQDDIDVHRVVLAWRAWAMLDVAGKEQAHTLLRQSVRFCAHEEQGMETGAGIRTILPRLLDQYKLLSRPLGTRRPDDAWVDEMSSTIYAADRVRAADAVAAALADGIQPEAIGEAISLAANQLVLRDPGRQRAEDLGKYVGSTHGSSVGVHASDAANAWRNIARVSNQRNTVASLIVGAFHTAGQKGRAHGKPYPWADQIENIKTQDGAGLLRETEAAIKDKNQARASALAGRYGACGHPERPLFDLLLKYAVSEDGALHAEKYYRTVSEEFATTRAAFRWRQLVALTRVTASEYGLPAPGYADACRLLKG